MMSLTKMMPTFTSITALIEAGDINNLRNLLDNGSVNPNECNEYGETLLMFASQCGQLAIVNELISQGADINAEDSDNWSALMNACKHGHKDTVGKLLDHGAYIEKRDMGSWTPLMWACYKGHTPVVQVLLDQGASMGVHDKYHCNCLIWAAGRGHLDIVKLLLEYGAKINSGDKFGSNPILWACRKGYTDIVEILVIAGANIDTAGMFSWTPLIAATKGNHVAIVNLFLEHKPNVNAVDMDGSTALTISCKKGYSEIAIALMNSGAYINLQDRSGDTNLIHATKAGHFVIVDALLKKYADVDLHGSEGKTALYWAIEKKYPDIVKLLLQANPNIESSTKDGDTALLKATRIRYPDIVQMLIDKKCKVSVTDKKGDTALHIAMRARSKAIVEILLRNPKNSQLLYRANRAGETPYNIDTSHQKSILAQIFGARRLNTNEDSENRLGYDLYSSALADILSEPSLSMPISVGLYAKWGSGKSFLLGKLESEMHNFAIQWIEPTFKLSWAVFITVFVLSTTCGLLLSLASQSHKLILAAIISLAIFFLTFIALGVIIYCSKKYYSSKLTSISNKLAAQFKAFQTLLFILFCNPPLKKNSSLNNPVRFIFTEQTKVTSSGNDNSIVQIVISLLVSVEKEYGFFTTRLCRVFHPRPVQSQHWQWKRICCIPNFLITLIVMGSLYGCLALLIITKDSQLLSITEPSVIRTLLITMMTVIGLVFISNIHTWIRLIGSLTISHQYRVLRNLSHVETSQALNYIVPLKSEVDIIIGMVQCLDAFIGQQSRLVVIVDGLDSCEQEKVLHVLDAVHLLFSDTSSPFLTVLAIDPHIIIKAIESNINRVFHNSSISGHEYLQNVVHLPFYLQNSGLRRVKAAQQAAAAWNKRSSSYWNEDRECDRTASSAVPNRKSSSSSISDNLRKRTQSKGNQKLKTSDSIASSISNLHRVVLGAQDLTKVLLTDDYFSDVNPRSMRRLMNIVYITGRLLKAFNIDFNWYHLASWVNITEQWPYRTSWIIMYYEMHENELDDALSLKNVYEKIRGYMPASKEEDAMLYLDHDERKFEVFLSFHSSNLLINDLKVFLPFTINLDPFIRKTVQEDHQAASEILKFNLKPHQVSQKLEPVKAASLEPVRTQKALLSPPQNVDYMNLRPLTKSGYRPAMTSHPMLSPPPSGAGPWWNPMEDIIYPYPPQFPSASLPRQDLSACLKTLLSSQKLSMLSVDGVVSALSALDKIDKQKMQIYSTTLKENNINGQVLYTCDLQELKSVLGMSFGDWEMFRVLVLTLREQEIMNNSSEPSSEVNQPAAVSHKPTAKCDSPSPKADNTNNSGRIDAGDHRNFTRNRSASTILEKQITMEDSMIVGALETLNEEALEDTLEEQSSHYRGSNAGTASSGIPSNPLSPILSDPEEQMADECIETCETTCKIDSPTETDIMYLKTMRDSPMLRLSSLSLCGSGSIADFESSVGSQTSHVQPILDTQSSPILVLRTSSETSSTTSSPSQFHPPERGKTKTANQRPSSLVYSKSLNAPKKHAESDAPSIHKPPLGNKKVLDKGKANISVSKHHMLKMQLSAEKNKDSSSDSSTETEEMAPLVKPAASCPKITSPQSDRDCFYSYDEHTPLVSSHRSSHYNLQNIHDKERTTDIQPDASSSKLRSPLERQFSIDSCLCDTAKLPKNLASSAKLSDSVGTHYEEENMGKNGFPVYGQNVTDTPSPDFNPLITESQSLANLQNETIV